MTPHHERWNGLEAWRLEDDAIRAIVLPNHGGKIASLVDLQTGREWLWSNPVLAIKPPRQDASFITEYDTGGFDECFPAVSAGPYPTAPWQDLPIPDHGELWTVPWETHPEGDGLGMVALTQRFPPRFERQVSLKRGVLRLEYRASNPSAHPFPFIWSSHPLFALEQGMRIDLPEGHPLEVYGSDRLGDRHTQVSWPMSDVGDLSRPTPAGWSAKLAGASPSRGWVGLAHGDRQLKFRYDPELVIDLGLWLNFAGWCPLPGEDPYFNFGLEPCIGWGDDLAYAVSRGLSYGVIPPDGERHWWLELSFGPFAL